MSSLYYSYRILIPLICKPANISKQNYKKKKNTIYEFQLPILSNVPKTVCSGSCDEMLGYRMPRKGSDKKC